MTILGIYKEMDDIKIWGNAGKNTDFQLCQNSLPLSQVRFISSSFWAHIWHYVDYCVIGTGKSNCAKYSNDAWQKHKVFMLFFPQITLWCSLLCVKNIQCEQRQNNINLLDEYVELITFCFVAQKWGQNLKLYMYDAIQINLLLYSWACTQMVWFSFLHCICNCSKTK